MNKTSLLKIMLLFYLTTTNNYTRSLHSSQLHRYISGNRYAQHFVGALTMMVMINMFLQISNTTDLAVYTIIGYSWFVLTTKLDLVWALPLIGVLIVGFLFDSKVQDDTLYQEEEQLTDSISMKNTLLIIAVVTTLLGTINYYFKKNNQYGQEFTVVKFLCR